MARSFSFKKLIQHLGPGFITGAADDDPAGIGTYAQAGAYLGYPSLWVPVLTIPLMIAVQELCARVGIVARKGLAALLQYYLPRPVVLLLIALLVAANSFNIGANINMMAAATRLLVPVPMHVLAIGFALASFLLQLFLKYQSYAKYLKWLTVSLFAYVLVVAVMDVSWSGVWYAMRTERVTWNIPTLTLLIALLGTTISPYLFFWQTSEDIEEMRLLKTQNPSQQTLRKKISVRRLDVTIGMVFSNLIAWFIMLVGAVQFHERGMFDIVSADQAASALAPLAGQFASTVFALGIIGTGLLSIPVLAGSAAYAVTEVFGVPSGLSQTFKQAKVFYGMIAVTIMLGLSLQAAGLNPIQALVYSAVFNGVTAPFFLAAIAWIGSRKDVMGTFRSKDASYALVWLTCVAMALSAMVWGWSII